MGNLVEESGEFRKSLSSQNHSSRHLAVMKKAASKKGHPFLDALS